MPLGLKKVLRVGFEDALARVPEALKAEGFGVLTEIDLAETLKRKLDVDFRRYRILGACNPALAREALEANRCPMASQPDPRPGGGRGEMAPNYDPDTVTTLRGTASSVTIVPARGGRMGGVHITLSSDGQDMDVHLGPSWFLDREGASVSKGDAVEVNGSVIELNGETFMIARELKTDKKAVKLRDEQGVPAWAGGRRP